MKKVIHTDNAPKPVGASISSLNQAGFTLLAVIKQKLFLSSMTLFDNSKVNASNFFIADDTPVQVTAVSRNVCKCSGVSVVAYRKVHT
jgi:hypothetical protein